MYGSLPAAEAAMERPARRNRPLMGSALVAALALAVVCVVFTVEHSGQQAVVLESVDDEISASQAGLLGRVGANTENTIGDLAIVAHNQHKQTAHKVAGVNKQPAKHAENSHMQDAMIFRQKALQLLQAKKKLQAEEKRIDAMTRAETAAYVKAVQQAKHPKAAPKAAHPTQQSQTAEVAKQVANMVLNTIEPQLNAQREEIAKLSAAAQAPQRPAQEVEHHSKEEKEHYPPAFPAHFHHPAPAHAAKKASGQEKKGEKDTSFQSALRKFLGETGVMNRVHGNQKAMADYRMDNGYEDPGQGAEPEGEPAAWLHPEHKGGPCSVAGNCNHGRTDQVQGPEYWAQHKLKRFKDDEEEGGDEEGEEGDEEVHLGNEVLMRSLDDFVPPNDAYIHNLLTSGADGIDHFGKLAPMSRENQILMYGAGMPSDQERILGKVLNTPGKGGAHTDEVDERRSPLGEDRIGDDDVEIPTALSRPPFPTEDYDHFDHWAYDSPENQELLNGIYWKRLKKDGFMDRILDSDEAHSQQIGDGHDTKPIPDFALGSWHMGFGYGEKDGKKPFERAREDVHGEDWREHVFTGTDENIEDQHGVVENMEKNGAYFRQHPARAAPTLKAGRHPILHRVSH